MCIESTKSLLSHQERHDLIQRQRAEIERLQAEVVKWKREAGKYTAGCEQCEPYRAALEQIKTVCEDNAPAGCRHDMALDFARQVATAALDRHAHTQRAP